MKKEFLLKTIVLAFLSCLCLTSCSSDDDEENNSSLAGTTWETSWVGYYNNKYEEWEIYYENEWKEHLEYLKENGHEIPNTKPVTITFHKDGTVVFNPTLSEWKEVGCWYTLDGNTLKIDFWHDDYTIGTITINGNQATYNYTWHDCDGKWDDNKVNTMTLKKK